MKYLKLFEDFSNSGYTITDDPLIKEIIMNSGITYNPKKLGGDQTAFELDIAEAIHVYTQDISGTRLINSPERMIYINYLKYILEESGYKHYTNWIDEEGNEVNTSKSSFIHLGETGQKVCKKLVSFGSNPNPLNDYLTLIKKKKDAPTILKNIAKEHPHLYSELEKITKPNELKLMVKFAKN